MKISQTQIQKEVMKENRIKKRTIEKKLVLSNLTKNVFERATKVIFL